MASPENKSRPRSRSMLSFGSGRSSGSATKISKADLLEAAKEKPWKRMTSKANPNLAVVEAEPVVEAQKERTINSDLRSMTFNDQYGNPITDPDRSNPTRPRLERPLDTIRSFESRIEGSYDKRLSRISEPMSPPQSRPSSFYPDANNGFGPRFAGEAGNYGNRMAPGRPESYIDPYGNRRPPPQAFADRRRSYASRHNSDPMIYGAHAVHHHGPGHGPGPAPGPGPRAGNYHNPNYQPPFAGQRRENHYQHAYDTATQGSSSNNSHGTEPWSNSTDPSSEASSVERLQQAHPPQPPKPDLGEQYGFSGFGGAPDVLDHGQNAATYGTTGNGLDQRAQAPQGKEIPPPPPPHLSNNNIVRQPVRQNTLQKRDNGKQPEYQVPAQRPATGEKRKSWLMRRFSKNN